MTDIWYPPLLDKWGSGFIIEHNHMFGDSGHSYSYCKPINPLLTVGMWTLDLFIFFFKVTLRQYLFSELKMHVPANTAQASSRCAIYNNVNSSQWRLEKWNDTGRYCWTSVFKFRHKTVVEYGEESQVNQVESPVNTRASAALAVTNWPLMLVCLGSRYAALQMLKICRCRERIVKNYTRCLH